MTVQTKIFGHRGYPAKFAENSLEGFKYVLDNGIDGIEFDVHLTKDNIPVIMHDEKIDRTTDGSGLINDYTLAELKHFKLANGESIPTLQELLELVGSKDVLLNLEFKTDAIAYPNIERIVLEMVAQANLAHPVIYSSFNLQTLRNCQAIAPGQNYNWLIFKDLPNADEVVATEKLAGIHPHRYQVCQAPQRVWTINDEATARDLFVKNIAGIFTNEFEKMWELRAKI
ncbi:glycerophosphodiester phosphodiesterase family protein [Ligilactobacillus sp. Marseille-Q7487]|jgi:glycerophosphoryl diester phosphodiesterase|uniref:glycerophosphodiester phosphodiesterase family protein n=1 Tax=Ligilactobacillus sp. Marseille-Q7487 TaxID=3022128 RepID=UPI0015B46F94|nr:glycerophosphodiester phosphodiesterase family protein [Ligilactobacillus sp. Marseille-Q7487]